MACPDNLRAHGANSRQLFIPFLQRAILQLAPMRLRGGFQGMRSFTNSENRQVEVQLPCGCILANIPIPPSCAHYAALPITEKVLRIKTLQPRFDGAPQDEEHCSIFCVDPTEKDQSHVRESRPSTACSTPESRLVMLRLWLACADGRDKQVSAFMDTGARGSVLRKSVADNLGYQIEESPVNLRGFGGPAVSVIGIVKNVKIAPNCLRSYLREDFYVVSDDIINRFGRYGAILSVSLIIRLGHLVRSDCICDRSREQLDT